MWAQRPVAREALLAAVGAAGVAAILAWLGPPGTDLAAHVYQRALFLRHGFTLWDNFWYAGRYSFVGYSVLYYPLAAVLGIRVLAVATVSLAALAFAVIVAREWGPLARWSSRSFALVWAGFVLTAAFPFALGVALALLALSVLQTGNRWRFALLTLLTLAASPVALLFLVVVLAGVWLSRRKPRRRDLVPALALAAAVGLELALLRLFPVGRFPFPTSEAAAALSFCALGLTCTWRLERARVLRFVFAAYALAIVAVYLVPSGMGENIARLRYLALPLAVLVLSLRRWRPLPLALGVVVLALAWNVTPLAAGWTRGEADRSARATAWTGPIAYLRGHLSLGFRVEAVDTTEHWPAYYLAQAGIPLARGWFRQDDFPLDAVLYRRLTPKRYLAWLRRLGVAYVVLTRSPPDYSARREAQLVRSGRIKLRRVFTSREVSIFAVPHPLPIVRGPGPATLLKVGDSRLVARFSQPGTYRIAVRWSPYWRASAGCLKRSGDGLLLLRTRAPGRIRIAFDVSAGSLWRAFAGTNGRCAPPVPG